MNTPDNDQNIDHDAKTPEAIPNDPAALDAARERLKQEERQPTDDSVQRNPYSQPVHRPTHAQTPPSAEQERRPLDDPNHPAHQRIRIPVQPAPWLTWKTVERLTQIAAIAVMALLAPRGAKNVYDLLTHRPAQPLVAPETPTNAFKGVIARLRMQMASGGFMETTHQHRLQHIENAFPFQIFTNGSDDKTRRVYLSTMQGQLKVTIIDRAVNPRRETSRQEHLVIEFVENGVPIILQQDTRKPLSSEQQEALLQLLNAMADQNK